MINQILRSDDYTGETTWCFADGSQYTIEIPRIIEPEQFERVQNRLERNKKLSTRNAKWIYLVAGNLEMWRVRQYHERKLSQLPLQHGTGWLAQTPHETHALS